MFLIKTITAMTILLASSCMQQRAPETLPAPVTGKKTGPYDQPGTNDNPLGQGGVTVSGSNLPLVFSEKSLKQNYALDTANLSYKFSYLDKNEAGPLVFNQGKAQLSIKGLKNGQQGDLTLELLEAGVVKLRGVSEDLTLTPGANKIALVLKPVDLPPGSTDLTIDVTLEDPPVTTTPPTTTVTPPTTTVTPPTTTVTPPTTTVTPPTTTVTPPTTTVTPPTTTVTPPTTTVTPPVSNGGLSFAKAVKPIVAAHCVECHHTGFAFGDFSTFPFKGKGSQDAITDKIIQFVESGFMPPKPRSKLSTAQLETLKTWRKDGLNP